MPNLFSCVAHLFALMGLALVFFLLVSKLTMATRILKGLVFYANIVGVNRTTLYLWSLLTFNQSSLLG